MHPVEKLRTEAGLSILDLSLAARVPWALVAAVEAGEKVAQELAYVHAVHLAQVLGVTVQGLFTKEELDRMGLFARREAHRRRGPGGHEPSRSTAP